MFRGMPNFLRHKRNSCKKQTQNVPESQSCSDNAEELMDQNEDRTDSNSITSEDELESLKSCSENAEELMDKNEDGKDENPTEPLVVSPSTSEIYQPNLKLTIKRIVLRGSQNINLYCEP